jgi:hypothetical protein
MSVSTLINAEVDPHDADTVADVGEILPGFALKIGEWFQEMDQLLGSEK